MILMYIIQALNGVVLTLALVASLLSYHFVSNQIS